MKKLNNLKDLLVAKLEALYDIEDELVKALPKMAEKATDIDLKAGFRDHLKETEGHVRRLEDAFKRLDLKPAKLKVEAIRGLIDDAKWCMEQEATPEAMDALLIASASYVEHYEMAGYMSASRWATMLGYTEIAELLEETLGEEQAADEKMAALAEMSIDEKAVGPLTA